MTMSHESKYPTLLVDADACPVAVRRLLEKKARHYQLRLIFITDQNHEIMPDYGEVQTVAQGHDAADYMLVSKVTPGDIVVTQDYGLAALVLARRAHAIHPGGMIYNNQNIDQLLMERHMASKARKAGERLRNHKRRHSKEDFHFGAQLESILQKTHVK